MGERAGGRLLGRQARVRIGGVFAPAAGRRADSCRARVQTCVHCDLGAGSGGGLLPLGVVSVWT